MYERENPGARKRSRVKSRYGVSLEEVAKVATEQNHRCAICKERPEKLVIDHCHSTGRFRALLCGQCNTGLGQFADNPQFLEAARIYAESWQKKLISQS